MVINEPVHATFYDQLYYIALKSLLIDQQWWTEINSQYFVKAELLNDGYTANPEIAIMLVNRTGVNVYEHRFTVLKTNVVGGTSALIPIMKKASFIQKANYILSPEPTQLDKNYRHCYIPIHRKHIDKDLQASLNIAYEQSFRELQDIVKKGMIVKPEKQYSLK